MRYSDSDSDSDSEELSDQEVCENVFYFTNHITNSNGQKYYLIGESHQEECPYIHLVQKILESKVKGRTSVLVEQHPIHNWSEHESMNEFIKSLKDSLTDIEIKGIDYRCPPSLYHLDGDNPKLDEIIIDMYDKIFRLFESTFLEDNEYNSIINEIQGILFELIDEIQRIYGPKKSAEVAGCLQMYINKIVKEVIPYSNNLYDDRDNEKIVKLIDDFLGRAEEEIADIDNLIEMQNIIVDLTFIYETDRVDYQYKNIIVLGGKEHIETLEYYLTSS